MQQLGPIDHDRRTSRSARPGQALNLFFAAHRRRLGVRALTCATADGRLVAGAGVGVAPAAVARAGHLVDRGHDGAHDLPRNVNRRHRIATWRLRIGTTDYVVTSLGGGFNADVGEGVRRILG